MGMLVDGVWRDGGYGTAGSGGRFERKAPAFRNWVTSDGAPGPSGDGGFPAEAGRYHLYVSLACPWAHRTLVMRTLKGLADTIDVSVVDPHMGSEGWVFGDSPGGTLDKLFGATRLFEIYLRSEPRYSGSVSVPVLWDRVRGTIVSNESSEIIRMMNTAFAGVGAAAHDFYPQALREEIDFWNGIIQPNVNDGVYRAGFATTQGAYEEAVRALFATLGRLEDHLVGREWLCRDGPTEADVRLFTTLVRFDAVYVGHFKCNVRRIADHPNLKALLRRVYGLPGVAGTVNLTHIKRHYYESHPRLDSTGIVPLGPAD